MSAEKYSSYTDAYREFRMNISENDFHDDYPETAEMTLAICTGLRYHYIRNYRSLSDDQTIQLIETFAKRCAKLDNYKDTLNEHRYSSESMITHKHCHDDSNPAFNEWLLLCHAYGLITFTHNYQHIIYMNLAASNKWVKRNTIQLKLLDKDIKRRNKLQQKLNEMGKLVNNIDEFNHIYKYFPVFGSRIGELSYKYIIDSYYDGHVDEVLGMDTIYEWILNDDVDKFQRWYTHGGLQEYKDVPRGNDKNLEYKENIAAHILSSNAVKIIRFIIMNNIYEFLDKNNGVWALIDPWRYPVNDPECFRLLQECFTKKHEGIIAEFINSDYENEYSMVGYVYRHIKSEIAEAIYHEITEISIRLYGTLDVHLCLYVAIEMAKFGHIGPIESLDWKTMMKTLSDKYYGYMAKYNRVILVLDVLLQYTLSDKYCDYLPFGMNPSTAVYLRDLFSENGLNVSLIKK